MSRFGQICCLVLAILFASRQSVSAQEASDGRTAKTIAGANDDSWLTGIQRRTQLRRTIRTFWSDTSLAKVIGEIATTQKINLFLDRRVDKNLEVRLSAFEGSVFEALHQVLEHYDLHGVWIDDVYYIGSLDHVARLIVMRERLDREVRQFPEPVRRKWLHRKQFQWARLTRPDDLMKREFPELGGTSLPHDLWPAWSSPDMTRLDLMLMIANSFDMEPVIDPSAEGGLNLVPQEPWTLDHPFETRISLPKDRGVNHREILDTIKAQYSESKIDVSERDWKITSTVEQTILIQEAIDFLFYGAIDTGNGVVGSQKVISLKSRASIGGILATVAKNLNVELQYDSAIRPILEKRIDIDVEDISYEELVEIALKDTGLTFELNDTALIINN